MKERSHDAGSFATQTARVRGDPVHAEHNRDRLADL